MKILVIGGMHGNEPLGPQLVEKLRSRPLKNIDGLIANELAYSAKARFVEQDMNRSFPGVKNSSEYEHWRPHELTKIAKNYDLVIDFHNTHCPDNDCAFVGETADDRLFDVARYFDLTRVVVADYDCMNKYAANCISVEISLDSKENDTKLWLDRIVALSNLDLDSLPKKPNLDLYKFVYRMTLEDRDRLKLEEYTFQAFKPIDASVATELGVKNPAYPIFINDAYTPYNYGGLLNKI